MKTIFRTASFFFILTVTFVNTSFAQHPVIFETFQEDLDLCPAPTDFQTDMMKVVNNIGPKNYSKMLHLNYHVGAGGFDPMAAFCTPAGTVDNYLNPTGIPNAYSLFYGDVGRQSPDNDIGTNGGISVNPTWATDMENQIDAEYTNTPPDVIQLVGATLDKSAAGYTFHANISVTATTAINESIVIRYAILEDGVSAPVCSTATTHNDVVRYITTGDSVVFASGTAQGTIANVSFTQTDLLRGNPGNPGALNPVNLRFIAFLESPGSGVVDAIQLISDLDTLQPPPPALAITSSFIDDSTFHPGQTAKIKYAFSNLPSDVMAYYSLDNGTNWRFMQNSSSSPINWTVPDSVTTQGKIQLVAADVTPPLVSTETGNFTIAIANSIGFTHPLPKQVIKGNAPDTVQWVENGITAATLQYSIQNVNGTFPNFTVIGSNITGTSYIWQVPDSAYSVVELQLVPVNGEAPATDVIDTIKSFVNSVSNTVQPAGLAITNIFPNPAMNGAEIVVQYTEAIPKPLTVQFLDLLGHTIPQSYSSDGQEIHLNTSSLMAGAYIVRLSDGVNTVSKRVEVIR